MTKPFQIAAKADGNLRRIEVGLGEQVVAVKNLALPILWGRFTTLRGVTQTTSTPADLLQLYAIAMEIEKITGEFGFLRACQEGVEPVPWTLCVTQFRPPSHCRFEEDHKNVDREIAKLKDCMKEFSWGLGCKEPEMRQTAR